MADQRLYWWGEGWYWLVPPVRQREIVWDEEAKTGKGGQQSHRRGIVGKTYQATRRLWYHVWTRGRGASRGNQASNTRKNELHAAPGCIIRTRYLVLHTVAGRPGGSSG